MLNSGIDKAQEEDGTAKLFDIDIAAFFCHRIILSYLKSYYDCMYDTPCHVRCAMQSYAAASSFIERNRFHFPSSADLFWLSCSFGAQVDVPQITSGRMREGLDVQKEKLGLKDVPPEEYRKHLVFDEKALKGHACSRFGFGLGMLSALFVWISGIHFSACALMVLAGVVV